MSSELHRTIALMIESDGVGGGERVVIQLAGELRRRGYRVVPVGPAVGVGWLAEQLVADGFEPETFMLRRPLDPLCLTGLVRLVGRHSIDLVHSHEFTMAVYGAAAAKLAGIPHVATMHGGMGYEAKWRRRAALRWSFRRSIARTAVSMATRDRLVEGLGVPAESIDVVRNGIRFSSGERAPVREELGLAPEELLILAIGNLYPVKGHIFILRALAAMLDDESLPEWRFAIAGKLSREEGNLRGYIEEAGLSDRVHLLGYRSDVANLLAAADIFSMPSLSEGTPMALLEAMFARKPIIASSVGGIPEILTPDEDALLVRPADAQALKEALRTLMLDPGRRRTLARTAEHRAREAFSVETMVDAYETLYARADGRRG